MSVLKVNMPVYLKKPNWKIISTNDKSSYKAAEYNTNLKKNKRRKLFHSIVNYIKKLYYWCKKRQVV